MIPLDPGTAIALGIKLVQGAYNAGKASSKNDQNPPNNTIVINNPTDNKPVTEEEEILSAIANQEWFSFKNNDKNFFNRNTALIWANLNYFPYEYMSGVAYPDDDDYCLVKSLLKEINSRKFGGFSSWRIPTNSEMPYSSFIGTDKHSSWCITDANGKLDSRLGGHRCVFVIPCSSALVPQYYSGYCEEARNVFIKNNLLPAFDSQRINYLYKKHYLKET